MKTTQQIASARTPDGETLALLEHDGEYSIQVGRQELMTSRAHESELELARLGCAQIRARPRPTVLVGGLGMGYTLRGALDALPGGATVVVGELMPEIVEWNRRYFGALSGHPLKDRRVQVRLGDELTKGGAMPEELPALADAVSRLPRLKLRGLMCIPPPAHDEAAQRVPFRRLRGLLEELNRRGHALDVLSMGMSDDLEAAVLEGATLVRIGTAVFGPRT